ncbi:MAG: hypothetical protein WC554_11235 [Clostridia bacterium]|jgi:hypothetical protein
MKLDDFKKVVDRRVKKCTSLMYGTKDEEYSRNNDKLHNFKRAAELKREAPERALLGMWVKHLVSILDMIDDLPTEGIDLDLLEEKMNDNHNYLFLLEAIILEKFDCFEEIIKK